MSALRTALAAAMLLFCFTLQPQASSAQAALAASPWIEAHASRARLVAGRTKTTNGTYLAGLEIGLDEGWKTYWRMPGDSGVPPSFDWKGSTNVAAVNVRYPAPMRMAEAGGNAIGYKRAVLLPIEITPEDPTKPITLKLELEYGACRDICIPVTGKFELSIAAGSAGAPPPEIATALERIPRQEQSRRKGDPELQRIAVGGDTASPKLTIEAAFSGGGKGADVFIEAPEGLYVPLPKQVGTANGGIIRFEADLGRDLAQDLKGKTLTLTFVSEAGATEAQWSVP
jgi:DsbC/DsbD-like thiol-disulfide interchange protein